MSSGSCDRDLIQTSHAERAKRVASAGWLQPDMHDVHDLHSAHQYLRFSHSCAHEVGDRASHACYICILHQQFNLHAGARACRHLPRERCATHTHTRTHTHSPGEEVGCMVGVAARLLISVLTTHAG